MGGQWKVSAFLQSKGDKWDTAWYWAMCCFAYSSGSGEGLFYLTRYQPPHSCVFLHSHLPGALEPHPLCLPTLPRPALWDLRGASPMPTPCPLQPSSASHSASTRWQPITSASPTAFSTAMTTGRWQTTWPRRTEVCASRECVCVSITSRRASLMLDIIKQVFIIHPRRRNRSCHLLCKTLPDLSPSFTASCALTDLNVDCGRLDMEVEIVMMQVHRNDVDTCLDTHTRAHARVVFPWDGELIEGRGNLLFSLVFPAPPQYLEHSWGAGTLNEWTD